MEDYLTETENGNWKNLLRPYFKQYRMSRIRFSPRNSALLIIDMQRFFLNPSSHACIPASDKVVSNVRRLLDAYRKASLPVIFTRHALKRNESPGAMGRWWGDIIYDDSNMSAIVPELEPFPGEIVIRKTRYSAFVRTDLEEKLRSMDVNSVVITGVMTHLCCETTARDAFVRDFDVFFVIDATGTRNDDLHISSLKTLADGFAIPVETDEVIRWMKHMTSS